MDYGLSVTDADAVDVDVAGAAECIAEVAESSGPLQAATVAAMAHRSPAARARPLRIVT